MIRKATTKDIEQVFPLIDVIWSDMDFPLRKLVDSETFKQAMINIMALPNHKFSIEHYWVYDIDGTIAGILSGYPGKYEDNYDTNLLNIIDQQFPDVHIREYTLDKETNDMEWYLDSIVVHADYRGQGIGTKFFNALPELLPKEKVVGLNCDEHNPKAKQLYLSLGFKDTGIVSFLGHDYHHMQKTINH